jgi:2-keto-4-pentenoate hydratase/2-oxohepta-3-ene-1,7-dioic acid hydratase in catechol pathway
MRTTTVNGRMAVVRSEQLVDVEQASHGAFPANPLGVFERWAEFTAWAANLPDGQITGPPDSQFGAPSPHPRQVFAIGLNYADHAAEAGLAAPAAPVVFTKFPSCIAGPQTELALPSDHVDWEAELVVIIGQRAWRVSEQTAWSVVAGLTVGQDYSERRIQAAGTAPQFSIGKSFPGFGPIGPVLVTPDEIAGDPDDLGIVCTVNDEVVQAGRTSQMIFSVRQLIARLSAICVLQPGDLIFTGTPAGVGMSRVPPRFLRPGDVVTTQIEDIGSLSQRCVQDVPVAGWG